MRNLNNVEQLLKQAVLAHLSEDELLSYHDNTIDEAACVRIEAHLDRCLVCERKLAMIQETLATYSQEPATDEEIDQLKAILHQGLVFALIKDALHAFTEWIQQHHIYISLVGARAAKTSEPKDGQTEDGSLRWRVVENELGYLIVRFGSHRMELAGVAIILEVGNIRKEIRLQPVTKDQIGAEVIFTREERAKLPADVQLTIGISRH